MADQYTNLLPDFSRGQSVQMASNERGLRDAYIERKSSGCLGS